MSTERTTGLTYDDLLEMFPEETNQRVQLIGGELIVAPAPTLRHQSVVIRLGSALVVYQGRHGGLAATAPDLLVTPSDSLQPDVLFFRNQPPPDHPVTVVPDLVVEVSSPGTRGDDLGRKKHLYEQFGVPEYWFVDLRADLIQVFRLSQGRYDPPSTFGRADTLESDALPGFTAPVAEILGPPA